MDVVLSIWSITCFGDRSPSCTLHSLPLLITSGQRPGCRCRQGHVHPHEEGGCSGGASGEQRGIRVKWRQRELEWAGFPAHLPSYSHRPRGGRCDADDDAGVRGVRGVEGVGGETSTRIRTGRDRYFPGQPTNQQPNRRSHLRVSSTK